MTRDNSDLTIGIEEEYLLVDKDSFALAAAPEEMMSECSALLEGQFSPEFLNCQVEIGSKVCQNISQARDDLKNLRSTVAKIAGKYNLAPIAASCHPFSDWRDQGQTDKARYNSLHSDLAGVVRRMLICGMHVHVGIEAKNKRIDLMNQLSYFLPHMLALSCSSPYWQGEDTGLSSYRLTVFDNLPRTGLPPKFDSWASYERSVAAIVDLGVVQDSSKIWWDLRPSSQYPTLESRICDVSPRLETALTLATVTQALTRMLLRLSQKNQRWRLYDNFLLSENRWRAQRYGGREGLIDFGIGEIVPFPDLVDELLELLTEDAEALGALNELENARSIVKRGTAADEQRAAYAASRSAGNDKETALCDVVRHLTEMFHHDL